MDKSKSKQLIKKYTVVIFIDFIILVLFISFLVWRIYSSKSPGIAGVFLENSKEIGALHLTDQHGLAFGNKQLEGHWTLMFFGFTHCPMICPTTLNVLNQTYKVLEDKLSPNLLPQVVFVTIDPERDTIARLKEFMNSYHPSFIAVRADINTTKEIQQQFSLSVSNNKGDIAHNTEILLLNPKAQIQAYFLYPQNPQSIASDYEKIVQQSGSF